MRLKIGGFRRRGTAVRPAKEHITNTGPPYTITSATWGRRLLFLGENWGRLLIDTIYHYRGSADLLHELLVMPDHIHVLLTPKTSQEKAGPFIQGGFSYGAKKEPGANREVWQKGFSNHPICDREDYRQPVLYVRQNPVRKHRCETADEFPHSSAHAGFELDPSSPGLKPDFLNDCDGAPGGAPFPSRPVASDKTMLSHDKNQIA